MQRAIVIGAGIGGIATSIRLAHKGFEVHVYESNSHPGGKLTSFNLGGFRFDAGPSLFTLPGLVSELFELCGESPQDHFSFSRQDTICNYFWEDGTVYQMPADETEIANSIVERFGERRTSVIDYLQSSRKKYELTSSIFLEKSLHKVSTYLNWQTAKAMINSASLGISKSLHNHNKQSFSNPKVVQLFDRYATYNGSTPYKTPAIMSMIPHLEMSLGTYFPEGGMQSITDSLVKLAERQGVLFHYNKQVDKIEIANGQASGVWIDSHRVSSDIVVSNMDIFSTYERLLPNEKKPIRTLSQERSSSALIFYWGIEGVFDQLSLHNILFSDKYREEFTAIFDNETIHYDPTVYINISSKCNASDAPAGMENWFVMINTPGDSGQDWDELISQSKQNIISKISRVMGIDILPLIKTESILDPRLIASRTMSHQGSLYGTASNSKFSAFLRHPNFSRAIDGLYFVGGSVHPGGGIPLCLNSAKIVANLINK